MITVALAENEHESGVQGRVTSMEEEEKWLSMAREIFPRHLLKYVDFRLSPTVEDNYCLFRGVRYRDVPDRPYDFVFVDGPKYIAPSDGSVTFDFDLLEVLLKSEHRVSAIIDKRVSTCFVLQSILGEDRVKYSAVLHLGFVRPSTCHDLRKIDPQTPSGSFARSFRVLGNSILRFR